MGEVVSIGKAAEVAWDAYVRAAKRAQETMRIEDGIAAGRAWAKWLDLFARGGRQ